MIVEWPLKKQKFIRMIEKKGDGLMSLSINKENQVTFTGKECEARCLEMFQRHWERLHFLARGVSKRIQK